MSLMPLRIEENAIYVPSGDQVGSPSLAGSLVSRVAEPPVAGKSQMSSLPPRPEEKAICAPSGNQDGPSVPTCVRQSASASLL
jgi:hypothetical protein